MAKRGRPKGSKNGVKRQKKRGRPKGSKNKKKGPVTKITISEMTPEKEQGIYTSPSEKDFKSKHDIDLEEFRKAQVNIEEGSLPADMDFDEFTDYCIAMSDFREKVEGEKRHIEIQIDAEKPIAIAFLSDVHAGSAYTDYKLLSETADIIREHPLAYCITGGDITDSLFFSYGDEILNMQAQYVFMQKLLREKIGASNILTGVCGNHEAWASKTGATNYIEFSSSLKRPLLHGVSYIDLYVKDVLYKILISHQFKGSSYINPTHQEGRANREIPGADIVMAAHTHKPGESNVYPQKYGGAESKVVLVNGKTFQKASSYGKNKGFVPIPESARGCNWIVLNHDRKMVRVMSNNDEMIETMSAYL